MKVKMLTTSASPEHGVIPAGSVIEVDAKRAQALLSGNAAVAVGAVEERAEAPAVETTGVSKRK